MARRSWEMKRYVRFRCRCSVSIRFMICAWMDTSSAEIGSSATMKSGLAASARAMPMRCCWPPENSCGYRLMCRGLSPTVAISSRTRSRFAVPACQAERLDRLRDDFADRHSRVERRVQDPERSSAGGGARSRSSRADRCARSVPSEDHFAGRRFDQPQDRAARASICRSPTRRPGPWFRLARMSSVTPSTASHDAAHAAAACHAGPTPCRRRGRSGPSDRGWRAAAQASGSGLRLMA